MSVLRTIGLAVLSVLGLVGLLVVALFLTGAVLAVMTGVV